MHEAFQIASSSLDGKVKLWAAEAAEAAEATEATDATEATEATAEATAEAA